MTWRHFDHDADIGVEAFGTTPAEAFEAAAAGLTAIVTDAPVAAAIEVELACQAPDLELLLADWLNALIYEMATRKCLFGAFEVTIDGERLSGRARGEQVDRARHRPAVEPKGVTLTALEVRQLPDGRWRTRCVIDV